MDATKKRRGGWPKREPEPGERVPMSFRVTPGLKKRLERGAQRSGRSLSQDIELRLESSFRDQDYFAELQNMLGGRTTFGIAMILARVMQEAGTLAIASRDLQQDKVESWARDPFAFDQAARAVMAVLDALRPAGEIPAPRVWKGQPEVANRLNAQIASLPESIAAARLQDVARPDDAVTTETQEWGRQVRDLLVEKKS